MNAPTNLSQDRSAHLFNASRGRRRARTSPHPWESAGSTRNPVPLAHTASTGISYRGPVGEQEAAFYSPGRRESLPGRRCPAGRSPCSSRNAGARRERPRSWGCSEATPRSVRSTASRFRSFWCVLALFSHAGLLHTSAAWEETARRRRLRCRRDLMCISFSL